jgi:hypothetical protein
MDGRTKISMRRSKPENRDECNQTETYIFSRPTVAKCREEDCCPSYFDRVRSGRDCRLDIGFGGGMQRQV